DDNRLIGLGPFFLEDTEGPTVRTRLLSSPVTYRTEPLAIPGREVEVGRAMVQALGQSHPRPSVLQLEGIPAGSPWPKALAQGWPGGRRAWMLEEKSEPAPTLSLTSNHFADWFAAKSRNFRQQMRRSQRHLEQMGAHTRFVEDPGELTRALADLCGLHHARWD